MCGFQCNFLSFFEKSFAEKSAAFARHVSVAPARLENNYKYISIQNNYIGKINQIILTEKLNNYIGRVRALKLRGP